MTKTIIVTGGAGFKSAGRLGTFQSCQWRSSDINYLEIWFLYKNLLL